MKPLSQIKLLGVPFSFGQDGEGVKLAPGALRKMGLMARLDRISKVLDLNDLDFSLCLGPQGPSKIKQEREASLANELLAKCIESEDLEESFLLNVGGDHGLGLGSIHGMLAKDPRTVVVWADAHGDINTPESSPSGNFHGMPLAFILGIAQSKSFDWIRERLSPEKLILMGPRDLDEGERRILEELSIEYYSSKEMNEFGTERILQKALKRADPEGVCPIHLSFDVDIFDSHDVHSTGTPVKEGPLFREVFAIGRFLGQTGRLRSMDLVEVNPEIGDEEEVTETLFLCLEFLESTLAHALGSPLLKRKDVLLNAFAFKPELKREIGALREERVG